MGSPVCPACSGKWAVISGGLCGVCRSLDRLAAYCRGPQFPAGAGDSLLTAVRTWIGFVQDLSETERGWSPALGGPPCRESQQPIRGLGVQEHNLLQSHRLRGPLQRPLDHHHRRCPKGKSRKTKRSQPLSPAPRSHHHRTGPGEAHVKREDRAHQRGRKRSRAENLEVAKDVVKGRNPAWLVPSGYQG